FDKNDSTEFVHILKEVELKRVLKVSERVNYDYIVSVSGSGGAFQLYISDEGFVYYFIDQSKSKPYKFVDKKLLDELLNIIQKQHP
ncbi:MAG TPA: hypothetical protein VNU45_12495, partial [Rummeliibacillus sp.]|nr:hypothetical protein [Rummeliibacillus sp.]